MRLGHISGVFIFNSKGVFGWPGSRTTSPTPRAPRTEMDRIQSPDIGIQHGEGNPSMDMGVSENDAYTIIYGHFQRGNDDKPL